MKKLLWVLLLASCFGQEIKRPTSDIDGGAIAGLGCNGTNKPSTGMSLSYDAAGLATVSTQSLSFGSNGSYSVTRVFRNWQSTANAYSALTLNVNALSSGWQSFEGKGFACANYSTDSGVTWTQIKCDDAGGAGFPQQTFSFNLSATQKLANLEVAVCVGSVTSKFQIGGDSIGVYDIWTSGTLATGPAAGTGSNKGTARQILIIN